MYGKLTFTSARSARIENNHCGLTDRSEKVSPTWERRADRRRDVEVRELPITKARRPQAVLLLCRPVQRALSDADGGRTMARREIDDERLGIPALGDRRGTELQRHAERGMVAQPALGDRPLDRQGSRELLIDTEPRRLVEINGCVVGATLVRVSVRSATLTLNIQAEM